MLAEIPATRTPGWVRIAWAERASALPKPVIVRSMVPSVALVSRTRGIVSSSAARESRVNSTISAKKPARYLAAPRAGWERPGAGVGEEGIRCLAIMDILSIKNIFSLVNAVAISQTRAKKAL